ncbi:amidohydrolase family protein [Actinomadura madurae]|uniref:amidohydrolase family protein n=2 Tax=Actinomadura madurae TaxID=1993 RepID=UPI0026E54894|nr:amidohydrolase family protein [Actinomadura madurae]
MSRAWERTSPRLRRRHDDESRPGGPGGRRRPRPRRDRRARPPVAPGRVLRGVREVLRRRAPHPGRPRDRVLLPRAPHGGRRVHGRRRERHRPSGAVQRGDRGRRGRASRRPDPVREHRPRQGPRRRPDPPPPDRGAGVRGIKFHPSLQGFAPDDRSAYPLLEVAAEHGVPALFHTGQTGIGAGMPGGGGIRLGLSNPMLLDDVAVDLPDLTIIMAHPSFPWQDEALAVATHKPNVYIDLSGWSPKYFPPQLVRYANSLLQDKVLFGSDFPVITPDRWREDFAKLEIKPHVRPKILKENAVRALRLGPAEDHDPDQGGTP